MPRVLAGTNGPTDWNEALDIISFGSPEQVLVVYMYFYIRRNISYEKTLACLLQLISLVFCKGKLQVFIFDLS